MRRHQFSGEKKESPPDSLQGLERVFSHGIGGRLQFESVFGGKEPAGMQVIDKWF